MSLAIYLHARSNDQDVERVYTINVSATPSYQDLYQHFIPYKNSFAKYISMLLYEVSY